MTYGKLHRELHGRRMIGKRCLITTGGGQKNWMNSVHGSAIPFDIPVKLVIFVAPLPPSFNVEPVDLGRLRTDTKIGRSLRGRGSLQH